MPRKLKQSRNTVRIPFQFYVNSAMTAGAFTLNLYASNLGAAASAALEFEFYRIVSLEYELLPRINSQAALSVSYYPDPTVGTVTLAQNMENPDAILIKGVGTVGNESVRQRHRVPATRLKGLLQWYKATADAGDAEFELQGELRWAGTGTDSVDTIVRGQVEYRNPIDTLAAAEKLKAKVRREVMEEMSQQLGGQSQITCNKRVVANGSK